MSLQDFLSGLSKNSSSSATKYPATISLDCGHLTTYLDPRSSVVDASDTCSFSDVFDGSSSNPLVLAANCLKKRGLEQQRGESLDCDFEQKKRRLMRNRESASRSRARKQVYTHELEGEVDRLAIENRKIKKQYEQLRTKVEDQIAVMAKCKLERTSSAPF